MEHEPGARDASAAEPAAGASELLARLTAVEQHLALWAAEVRTQRVVVVDDRGAERIVTAVGESFSEVRLRIGEGRRGLDLVLVTAHEPSDRRSGTAGIEVWLDGDHVGSFTVMPER